MTDDTGQERTRTWWRHHLSAAPDPAAGFDVGPGTLDQGRSLLRYSVRMTSYGTTMTAALLRPAATAAPPAVIVPFYDVATVLGERGHRTRRWSAQRLRGCAYACHLADRGFVVLAVPWWFEEVVPAGTAATSLHERYGPAAARHAHSLPGTGLGRSVGDLVVAVDALTSLPWVDAGRIGVFGHSLGAKLALHLAALDTRIRVGVAHEPGLGFAHSNWSDPWYLGADVPPDRDQDEVLGLVAPRPFLLAGGGDGDGAHNRHLVERARNRWDGRGARLETLYHDNGHAHPVHVLAACYAWLETRFAASARQL